MWYRFFLLAGVTLLVLSLVILSRSLAFVRQSERGLGVVTQFDTITGGDAGTTYVPVFMISAANGRQIVYHHHSSGSPPLWDVGEKAMFLFDPKDPSSVRMYTHFGVFSWSIVLMGAAVFLITLGTAYFRLRRYWR